MSTLHEISKDYIGFLDSDLEQDELIDCLESIQDAFEDKGVNIVKVINSFDNEVIAPIDAEIKRLQDRKKTFVNTKERLKEYLRENMEATGINKINHPLFNITLGKPTVTAEVLSADDLPSDYVTVKTTTAPDKRKILKDLKEGVDIPGAALSTGKSRLLIK